MEYPAAVLGKPSSPAHGPGKCAAIRDCRRSGNARKQCCAAVKAAREIVLRNFRSARAERPPYSTDSPPATGAGSALFSQCDSLGRSVGLWRSVDLPQENM